MRYVLCHSPLAIWARPSDVADMIRVFLSSLLLLCAVLSPVGVRAEDVVVFAAASLKAPLDRVFANRNSDAPRVLVSYGGSGAMAQQILRGAPADIYIGAHPQWMDVLQDAGRIGAEHRVDWLGNALVLAGPAGSAPIEIEGLAAVPFQRLALGQTQSVPAGQYARAGFEALGLWDQIAPRVVETENVQAAARLLRLGEVDMAVIYATDAQALGDVTVVARFAPESHPAIVYPMGLLNDRDAARDVVAGLQSDAARAVFEAAGFVWLPAP